MKSKYVFINEDEVHESMIVRSTSLNDVVNNFLPSKNSSLLPTQVTY